MLMNNAKLAWYFYQQEYRYPHQRLLRWVQGALLLFIVSLSLSSGSIQAFLAQNLQGLLGADAVLSQKQALTAIQYEALSDMTDEIAVTRQIKTMLTHGGQWQQVQLKAVGRHYPLQGELLASEVPGGNEQVMAQGPELGHIWLGSRAQASLSIDVGQRLVIAGESFLVSRILQHEPDRLMEGHSVAMRAMINLADMDALNLPADLILYRYLLAASDEQIAQIIHWQQEQVPAAVVYHKQGKHPLALFWQRTENFLGLASILLFFMAAIAIEQLAQMHIKKDRYFTGVCMSVGASKAMGIRVSFLKWLIGVVLLLPSVLILSTLSHYLVVSFLNDTFSDIVWQIDFIPTLKPIAALVLVFALFHAPVWLALSGTSVASLFNGATKGTNHWLSKLCSFLVLCAVALVYSDNGLLTLMMLVSVILVIGLMILLSWSSLTLGERITQGGAGLLPFALFMMKQRLLSKSTQILGIGLCAFLLLFTLMLLKDLGATMSSYQRQHDGNVFISQASQEQMDFVSIWAKEQGIEVRQIKPYLHAKLVAVNGQSLKEFSQTPSDSLATFSQAIRLHWSGSIPENNSLVSGQWWLDDTTHWQQISVEQEVMTDLGLVLGDKLSFVINNQTYHFDIVANHEFKPGAGSITFWVQMPPEALAHIQAPQYNMASIELNDAQWTLLVPLWQKFPTLRMVSLKELTQLFDKTLTMVTKVISGFSLMIVLLSVVVILASIKALESKEKKKNSVIMSFGFSRATCLKLNIIEWSVTAIITAFGAIAGTYIAGLLIYQSQFSLTYQPNFTWLTLTLLIILSAITGLGVYASRNSLKSSVSALFANS